MKSIFVDKDLKPTTDDLMKGLGETHLIWKELEEFTKENYPKALYSLASVLVIVTFGHGLSTPI